MAQTIAAKSTYFNWSTGKDSALALYKLKQNPEYIIQELVTTVNRHFDRVSMHGLRRELMEKQMQAIGLPFTTVELPESPSMEEYDVLMNKTIEELKRKGFQHAAFGDIFLEDLRAYRENHLQKVGITAHFPLWKKDTTAIANEFIELGFKAIIVCCNSNLLDESFVGRTFDRSFLADLPENVDPCGENGEFHTFCYAGPLFKESIPFKIGEKVFKSYKNPENCGTDSEEKESKNEKDVGFWYCDLIPE